MDKKVYFVILKGGCWHHDLIDSHTSNRPGFSPIAPAYYIGFRLIIVGKENGYKI